MRKVLNSSLALAFLLVVTPSDFALGEEADLAESTLALNRAAINDITTLEYGFTIQGEFRKAPGGPLDTYQKEGLIKLTPGRLFVWWDQQIEGEMKDPSNPRALSVKSVVKARQYYLIDGDALIYWADHTENPVAFQLYPNGDVSETAYSQISSELLDTVFVVIGVERLGLFEGYVSTAAFRSVQKPSYTWKAKRMEDSRIELIRISQRGHTRFIVNPLKGGLVEESETLMDGKVAKRTRADLVKSAQGQWFPRETLSESFDEDGSVRLRVRTAVNQASVGSVKSTEFKMSAIPWRGGVRLTKYMTDGRLDSTVFVGGAWMPRDEYRKLPLDVKLKAQELPAAIPNQRASSTAPSQAGEQVKQHRVEVKDSDVNRLARIFQNNLFLLSIGGVAVIGIVLAIRFMSSGGVPQRKSDV